MCAVSKQEMDLDTFAEDIKNHAWMADCEIDIETSVFSISDIEHVRKTEVFMFKRATDDDSIPTFHTRKNNKNSSDDEKSLNASPTKKQRRQQEQTTDVEMLEPANDKQTHTYEIMLSSKEQEIQSLRQRLEALTASGVQDNTTEKTPDERDRLPSNPIGLPPGLETDLGAGL